MDENTIETVELSGIKVPKAFAARWEELLAVNRKMKTQLQESQAALVLAQEEAATGSSKELEASKARIKELEGEIEKSGWTSALAEDGLGDDADVLDYLQYQYGKVQAEEGGTKPSIKDWYAGFREKSPVVQAARKAGKKAKAESPEDFLTPSSKVEKAPTKTVPAHPKQIPASDGAMTADKLVQMDDRDFAANKDTLRKQLFGN